MPKQVNEVVFEGQHITVRTIKGRDGKVKYGLHWPGKPESIIQECDAKKDALRRAQSIEAHNGNFRAASDSHWSIPGPSTPVYNAVDKAEPEPSTALAQLPLELPGDIPTMPAPVTREPTWDGWVQYGQALREHQGKLDRHVKNYQLVLGRWAAYGIDHWQRPAERKIKDLGFAPGTIANFAWVARRIPETLQNDGLSFEHYRAIAALPEGEREEWAARAKAEDLSGRELHKRIGETHKSNGNGKAAQPSLCNEGTEMDAPARGGGVVASSPLEDLIADWTIGAERLIRRGDELSRAQADCYLDCANNLREALGA